MALHQDDESIDDTIIEIEESNVNEVIPNVVVIEKQIKEDAVLSLNRDQIINEITNLLVSRHKHNKIPLKVDGYMNMFDGDGASASATTPMLHGIDSIKPIVLCTKILTSHGDKKDIYDMNLDKNYQDSYNVEVQSFDEFITQFQNLQTSKNESYVRTVQALHAAMRPFKAAKGKDIDIVKYQWTPSTKSIDAYRHFIFNEHDESALSQMKVGKYETFRLLPKVEVDLGKRPEVPDEKPGCTPGLHYVQASDSRTLYEGDIVDIVGFVNMTHDHTKEFREFDVSNYIASLKALEENQKVTLYFNDYVYSADGACLPLDSIEGKVVTTSDKEIHVKTSKKVLIAPYEVPTQQISISLTESSVAFVYPSQTLQKTQVFHKPMLATQNILFKISSKISGGLPTLMQFIIPKSMSEILRSNEIPTDGVAWHCILAKLEELGVDIHNLSPQESFIINNILSAQSPIIKNQKLQAPQYHIHAPPKSSEIIDVIKTTPYQLQYTHFKTFIDSALNRYSYLKSKNDYGYLFFVNKLKQLVENKISQLRDIKQYQKEIDTIQTNLDKLNIEISKTKSASSKSSKPPVITKIFYSYADMLATNGTSNVYFDKEYDPTDYSLLGKIDKSDKQYALIELLLQHPKYASLKRADLEFEAQAIIDGRRKIRLGDNAILQVSKDTKIMYTRMDVGGLHIWVKVMRAPFQVCSNQLSASLNDNKDSTLLVLDSFDMMCKKIEEVRLNSKYARLVSYIARLQQTIEFIEDSTSILHNLDKLREDYLLQHQLLGSEESIALSECRRPVSINPQIDAHDLDVDYSTFLGDSELLDFDKIFNNVEYGDQSQFEIFYDQYKKPQDSSDLSSVENMDILQTFMGILNIAFEHVTCTEILQNVNSKFPKASVIQEIIDKEKELRKKVNQALYEKSNDYKQKFEALVKSKLKDFEEDVLKKYYHKVIVAIAAWVTLKVMQLYPKVVIQKIMPKCIKYFSYTGHPLSKPNAQQSLTKFMACVLSSIGTPGDLRFDQFSHIQIQDIESELIEEIDFVMSNNAGVQQYFEFLQTSKKGKFDWISFKPPTSKEEFNKYTILNDFFKPNFDFKNTSTKSKDVAIDFVKEVQSIVGSSKALKQSTFHTPMLMNACCIEQISTFTNYYDFFENIDGFKDIKKKTDKLESSLKATLPLIPKLLSYPKHAQVFTAKPVQIVDSELLQSSQESQSLQTNSLDAFIKSNKFLESDPIMKDILKNVNDDDWWGDYMYQHVNSEYDSLVEVVRKYCDSCDKDIFNQIKGIIISMKSLHGDAKESSFTSRLLNLRNTLMSYIKNVLTKDLAIISTKTLNEDVKVEKVKPNTIQELQKFITNQGNTEVQDIVKRYVPIKYNLLTFIDNIVFKASNSDTVLVQNIMLLTFIILKVYASVLTASFSSLEDLSSIQNINSIVSPSALSQPKATLYLTLSSRVIYYLLVGLHKHIMLNDTNNDVVKKKIEVLREKKKQDLIAAYSTDDEKRKLQVLLKKMGLNILGGAPTDGEDGAQKTTSASMLHKDIQEVANKEQENENYKMTFQGENPDDNEVEE